MRRTPARRPSGLALASLALALLGAGACSNRRDLARAEELFGEIEDERVLFGEHASNLATYRGIVESLPEVAELRSLGAAAARAARERLRRPPAQAEDNVVAVAAYVVELQRATEAIPELEAYLLGSPGDRGLVWAPHFVVRALLVLRGLPDPAGGTAVYGENDVRRALGVPTP